MGTARCGVTAARVRRGVGSREGRACLLERPVVLDVVAHGAVAHVLAEGGEEGHHERRQVEGRVLVDDAATPSGKRLPVTDSTLIKAVEPELQRGRR